MLVLYTVKILLKKEKKMKLISILLLVTITNMLALDIHVTHNNLKEFAELYKKRPIKDNAGGMKSVGMFWVWYITKKINPDVIVESGIWKGQSTWLLEQAAPQAQIFSIDPNLKWRKYISSKVTYYSKDFSHIDFGDLSGKKTLCFFDDHQNAVMRVKQAQQKGFIHLLFDDNYPPGAGTHLTLAHCFAKNNEQAAYLRSIMRQYSVLPQIYGTKTKTGEGSFSVESLNLECNDENLIIYAKDAYSYRWTTYIELIS